MKTRTERAAAAHSRAAPRLLDPIDDQLLDPFYHPEPRHPEPRPPSELPRGGARRTRAMQQASVKAERPTHYKICCISLYLEDIAKLDALVAELKRRGHTKANKSLVIRAALDQIDLSKIPKGY